MRERRYFHYLRRACQVNISMMLGALLSHGWLWPLVKSKEGDWCALLPGHVLCVGAVCW